MTMGRMGLETRAERLCCKAKCGGVSGFLNQCPYVSKKCFGRWPQLSLKNFICQTRTVCHGVFEQILLPKLSSHMHSQSAGGWIVVRFSLKLYLNLRP